MWTRLQHDLRGLLVVWWAGLGLVVAPAVIAAIRRTTLGIEPALGVAALLVAGLAFGRGFGDGTVGLTLAQPIHRSRLWWERLLATAIVTTTLAGVAVALGGHPLEVACVAVVAMGGGVGFSLLSRHPWGGSVFGLALPLAVLIVFNLARDARGWAILGEGAAAAMGTLVSALYASVMLLVGYLAWSRLEDRGSVASGRLHAGVSWTPGRTSPWIALVAKELTLQRASLWLVVPVVAAAAFALVWRGDAVVFGLVGAWVAALIGAMLIGATAVTEERALGTFEAQLALPASRGRQLATKLGVTWALSLLVGAVVPAVLFASFLRTAAQDGASVQMFLVLWAGGCLLLTTMAFVTAEVSDGGLDAIGKTLLLLAAVATSFLLLDGINSRSLSAPLERAAGLGVVALVVLPWLAWRGFEANPRWRFSRLVSAAMVATLLLTPAIGVVISSSAFAVLCFVRGDWTCSAAAHVYEMGYHAPRSPWLARAMLRRACTSQAPRSSPADDCFLLGRMYDRGAGVAADRAEASQYYERACDGGLGVGCTDLARLSETGPGSPNALDDPSTLREKAVELWSAQCATGLAWISAPACMQLGRAYQEGQGVARDPQRAVESFSRACRLGDMGGCDVLLDKLERDADTSADEAAEARRLAPSTIESLQDRCKDGRPRFVACVLLASAYERGLGVEQDLPRAGLLYADHCDRGRLRDLEKHRESDPWHRLRDASEYASPPGLMAEARDVYADTCAGHWN